MKCRKRNGSRKKGRVVVGEKGTGDGSKKQWERRRGGGEVKWRKREGHRKKGRVVVGEKGTGGGGEAMGEEERRG